MPPAGLGWVGIHAPSLDAGFAASELRRTPLPHPEGTVLVFLVST